MLDECKEDDREVLAAENARLKAELETTKKEQQRMVKELQARSAQAATGGGTGENLAAQKKAALALGTIAGVGVAKDASADVAAKKKEFLKFDAAELGSLDEKKWVEKHDNTAILQEFIWGTFEGARGPRNEWNALTKIAAMHSMFLIMSECMGFANSKWISPLMTMFLFVLLSMTKCPTMGTVCAGLFAGMLTCFMQFIDGVFDLFPLLSPLLLSLVSLPSLILFADVSFCFSLSFLLVSFLLMSLFQHSSPRYISFVSRLLLSLSISKVLVPHEISTEDD